MSEPLLKSTTYPEDWQEPPDDYIWVERFHGFVCLALTFLLAWRWLSVVTEQINHPWDLNFESPNLCSILLLKQNVNIYSPTVYDNDPFVISLYTPLYHFLVSLFPIRENNPFYYGRLVSLISFSGLALIILFRGACRFPRPLGILISIVFLSIWSVTSNSAFLKNDPLGILLSVSGMLLAVRSRSLWVLTFVSLLIVAGVAVKQSYLAAGLSTAVYLALNHRLAFTRYLSAVTVLGISAAALATYCFGNGFWFSTIGALRNPFELTIGLLVLQLVFSQPTAVVLVAAALVILGRRIWQCGFRTTFQQSPVPSYFLMAIAVFLLTVWKQGASSNYIFETCFGACLLIAEEVRVVVANMRSTKFLVKVGFCFCLACLIDLLIANPQEYRFDQDDTPAVLAEQHEEYRQLVRQSEVSKPRVLNLSTHRYMFDLSKNPDFNDPLQYHMLWRAGRLSPDRLIDALHSQTYDVVIISSKYGTGADEEVERKLRSSLSKNYRVYAVSEELDFLFLARHSASK